MTAAIESPKDIGEDPSAVVTRWLRELELADKHESKWRTRGEEIVKRYRDEREDTESGKKEKFNILYANTEVLKGVMYQHAPAPDVRRRHKGQDPVGREAAQLVNQALVYSIDQHDMDDVLRDCVEDVLLPGRCVAREKYVSYKDDTGAVVYEEAVTEYVEWDMFRYSPARTWKRVRWVAFGELLTRDELRSQFPDVGAKCALDWTPKGMEDTAENQMFKRALVWQVWNKTDKKVYVVCGGYRDAPLAVQDDPLRLEKFFPCPKPVYGVKTTNSLIPVPEYTQYQDQAAELDRVTERINVLIGALKRRGVYDGAFKELEGLADAGDNKFIPIEDFSNFSDKGGLEKAFMEAPIEGIGKVLIGLYQQREQIKTTIYEVTGISDIARGASNPNETLGAQKLKSQYNNVRIQPRQHAIEKFARDLLRIKAEIIAEHFSPDTLSLIVGKPVDPQVIQLIKQDKMRCFTIDIETDSTIQPDADDEQKNRVELLTAITTFMGEAIPAVQSGAVPMDVAKELMMFGVRAFKTGPQVEEVLDQWSQNVPNGNPADQQKQQMQMQQQAEQLQMQQQEMAKKGQELAGQEQQLKDQGNASAMERMKLEYDKKLFTMEQTVQKFMTQQSDQVKAEQDKQKAESEQAVTAKLDEKESMFSQLAQSQQVLVEMMQHMIESQNQLLQGQQQVIAIASADRESEVIRGTNGKAQKAISRVVMQQQGALQ